MLFKHNKILATACRKKQTISYHSPNTRVRSRSLYKNLYKSTCARNLHVWQSQVKLTMHAFWLAAGGQQRAAGGHYDRRLESIRPTSYQKSHSANRYDAYLLEEEVCKISSRSHLKRRSLILFWRASPQQLENKNNSISSDMRSVPDLKTKKKTGPLENPICNTVICEGSPGATGQLV